MSKPEYLTELNLPVSTFNALSRMGVTTVEESVGALSRLALIHFRATKCLCSELHAHGYLPHELGYYVDKEEIGAPLTFDELADYVGKLVLVDVSTESHAWHKVVLLVKIQEEDADGRRALYYDGGKSYSSISEVYFTPDKPQMYRLKAKREEEPAPQLAPLMVQEIEEKVREEMKEYISIDSSAFSQLRENFNKVMKDTLMTMQKKDSASAAMTIKIDISLVPMSHGDRSITVPTFTHKVTSAIQMKEERSGKFGGRHEIYYDELHQNFAIREIPPVEGQMDLPFFEESLS